MSAWCSPFPRKPPATPKKPSLIELGVNFPADAEVIDPRIQPFNRANPASYNKSTALTVYDKGGNGYLATIYYVKTQNASQGSPTNKWQTYVFVGEDEVKASLLQATDDNNEELYVNKYGQTKPFSEVKDLLVNTKTKMFALDELTDTQVSVAASLKGAAVTSTTFDMAGGVNFSTLSTTNKAALKSLFTVDVDGSGSPVTVDLSYLANKTSLYTGDQIATEITNVLNRKFGGERYFDFTSTDSRTFNVTYVDAASATRTAAISLTPDANNRLTMDQVVTQINEDLAASNATTGATSVSVVYDPVSQGLVFTESTGKAVSLATTTNPNTVMGLTTTAKALTDGLLTLKPNTEIPIRRGDPVSPSVLPSLQRYGIKVSFDPVGKTFQIASGTTGDDSSWQSLALPPLAWLPVCWVLLTPRKPFQQKPCAA
jgi:flagellar hook protein FlgE